MFKLINYIFGHYYCVSKSNWLTISSKTISDECSSTFKNMSSVVRERKCKPDITLSLCL